MRKVMIGWMLFAALLVGLSIGRTTDHKTASQQISNLDR
jgi:hypothetical protein